MVTPADLSTALESRTGRPYWSADGRRLVDSHDPGNDCSGWIVVGLRACGVEPGGFVSSSIAQWCYAAGLELDVHTGIATFGALLFWGPNRGLAGFGDAGHIALSLGNGQILETPSSSGRVSGRSPAQRPGAPSGAGLIPGLSYDGPPGTIPSGPVFAPPNDGMLRLGSTGFRVAELQRRLKAIGEPVDVDGEFGPVTDAAVRRFQATNGLEVDGVVGPQTWNVLTNQAPPIDASPGASGVPPWPGRFLILGSVGDDVRTWQQRMQQRQININVDGIYGAQSQTVCSDFQRSHNLEIDGVVGPETWNAAWTVPT